MRRKHETNTEGTALLERPVQPDGIAIAFSISHRWEFPSPDSEPLSQSLWSDSYGV